MDNLIDTEHLQGVSIWNLVPPQTLSAVLKHFQTIAFYKTACLCWHRCFLPIADRCTRPPMWGKLARNQIWYCNISHYCISSNWCHPQIVGSPRNSDHTIGSSKRNKHHPQIVAAACIRGTHTRVRIISDDGHHTSAKATCVVRVVSTAPAGLRGYIYYWQRLALVTISLVCTLTSHHWCLWAFQRNKMPPFE